MLEKENNLIIVTHGRPGSRISRHAYRFECPEALKFEGDCITCPVFQKRMAKIVVDQPHKFPTAFDILSADLLTGVLSEVENARFVRYYMLGGSPGAN